MESRVNSRESSFLSAIAPHGEQKARAKWLKLFFAFLAVYVIWGSTYIAIKFALESMPPFFMVAVRFLIAGLVMYAVTRLRGAAKPERSHILPTFVLGVLLLGFGTTGVVLAERTLPTGLVSLLVATVPVYIILLQWFRPGGSHPGSRVLWGLFLGVSGLVILIGPAKILSGGINLTAVLYVLIGSLGSAVGALYSRNAKLPPSKPLAAGLEMIFAGLVLFVISACAGELSYLQHFHLSFKSLMALVYLIVFGSMLAFSAYVWLLKEVTPSRVSTYAYVNPVVAVFLGWLLAGEGVTMQTLLGAGVILAAVWLITQAKAAPKLKRVPLFTLDRQCSAKG